MREIVKTEFYEMKADDEKNRLYLKLKGFWKNPEMVANYVNDMGRASASMKSNFTLLTDLTELAAIPVALNKVHEEAQNELLKNGLHKTAEVVENIVLKSVSENIAKNSAMPKKEFETEREAEKWLDTHL